MEGGADSQQLTNNSGVSAATNSGMQVDFAIGRSDTQTQKPKVKNMDELAEERMRQTFNVGAGTKDNEDLKRKREDYAVQLRKNKRYVMHHS
jgi:hypothetical protein